ncbi:MAG: hypothetical protein IPG09_00605 [Ignavibacteria bacterium]|nr:hypothetical protein [Ignavibacteria bacterium]
MKKTKNNNYEKVLIPVILLIFVSYFSSCSSVTEISGTWKKPATAAKKFSKIAILGLSGDVVKRSAVENAVVAEFRRYGITAVSGTNILPDSFMDSDKDGKADDKNKDAVAKKLKELGVDGAMVLSLMDKKETEHYVPVLHIIHLIQDIIHLIITTGALIILFILRDIQLNPQSIFYPATFMICQMNSFYGLRSLKQ